MRATGMLPRRTDARPPPAGGVGPFGADAPAHDPHAAWGALYRTGAWAALTVLALMPVQIVVWLAWPPPSTVDGFFALFRSSPLLGLLGLDLLYMVTNALMLPLLLAMCVSLRRTSPTASAVALTLGVVSIAAYFASTAAIEMFALSGRHAAAASDAERALYLAAGEALLATYKGTAFAVYYLMNGAALVVIATAMLRGGPYGRATASVGLLAGALMVVPSTFGTLGMIFSLASLVPWAVFSVLVARTLLALGRGSAAEELGS